ncbi:hypothetical protein K2173_026830 [Erythroxylum novogranatense]|uniref:NAC domain-containing protein n=1 Tax=Erythroxylum novogranatense TaxID=1862640 RepID=A0AAV8TZU9_9ROSI|nr:hypothetical protein K2173_026830 [Erythroxylum novogranatense]
MEVSINKGDDLIDLPTGFRFHPTDEEIITHYLTEKVMKTSFSAIAIGDVDLNKCEPWDMPKKAKMGEKEWYFFCQRDRKYPTGLRTNRATEAGYWKATGKDREIYKGKNCLVGMKKTLVFYKGRAPKGEKTNWVMHEYRLEGKFSYYSLPKVARDEWVVCRVFHKSTGMKKTPIHDLLGVNSFADDFLDSPSLPALMDYLPYSNRTFPSFSDGDNEFKEMTSRSSDGNYFSHLSTNINGNTRSFFQPSSSIFHTQIPVSNPLLTSPNMLGYLHQGSASRSFASLPRSSYGGENQTLLRALAVGNSNETSGSDNQCKVEHFSSNQTMVSLSQDTGLSTDINTTEISSVLSKHDRGSNKKGYEDLETPPFGPIADLECLWDY